MTMTSTVVKSTRPNPSSQPPADLLAQANAGDAFAQVNLGDMYVTGQGVVQDYGQAVAWYRTAADQGNTLAQASLGVRYAKGQGVTQDYVEAHKWVNLAAAHASAENQKAWADDRDRVATLMTPQQIAEAQERATEWQAAFDKRTRGE